MAIAAQAVVVGKISGVYGIKGWVRVFSYTEPRTNILHYRPWQLAWPDQSRHQCLDVLEGHSHGGGVVAQLAGIVDRDMARALMGADIYIARDQLPALPAGEYYWVDLIGLQVINTKEVPLGKISEVLATSANDVLVVQGERERLIPFVRPQIVVAIDTAARIVRVDWEAEY